VEDAANPSFKNNSFGSRVASNFVNDSRNLYTLKVLDTGGQINLNSPQDSFIKADGTGVLHNLGRAIASEKIRDKIRAKSPGLVDNASANPFGPNLGTQKQNLKDILTLRNSQPGKEFRSKERIIEVIGNDNFELLRNFVTVHSFKYEGLIKPVFQMGAGGTMKNGPYQGMLPKLESRYAVNVNTASTPVLTALFAGVRGYARLTTNLTTSNLSGTKTARHSIPGQTAYETLYKKSFTKAVSITEAKKLADAIYKRTHGTGSSSTPRPFRTWQEFQDFIRYGSSSSPNITAKPSWNNSLGVWEQRDVEHGLKIGQREAIIANANPNANYNRWIPDAARFYLVEKSDLEYYTNEFCFSSMGHFEVTSLGRTYRDIAGAGGSTTVLSESKVSTVVKAWEVVYKSTQKDFLNDLSTSSHMQTYPEPYNNVAYSPMSERIKISVDGQTKSLESPARSDGTTFVARGGSYTDGYLKPSSDDIRFSKVGGSITMTKGKDTYQKSGYTSQTTFLPFDGAQQTGQFDGAKPPTADPKSGTEQNRASARKTAGVSIFRDESLTPDGMLSQHNRTGGEEINYNLSKIPTTRTYTIPRRPRYRYVFTSNPGRWPPWTFRRVQIGWYPARTYTYKTTSSNVDRTYGAVGFWIKLDGEHAQSTSTASSGGVGKYLSDAIGANEPLLVMTWIANPAWRPQGSPTSYKVGVTQKLERFGNKLKCSRFLWYDPPMTKAFQPTTSYGRWSFSEWEWDITSWNSHEWHHIVVGWDNSFSVTNPDQMLYVDGKASNFVGNPNIPNPPTGGNSNVRFFLASGDPSKQELLLGGSMHKVPPPPTGGSTVKVHRGTDFPVGFMTRASNCVIDDVIAVRSWRLYNASSNLRYLGAKQKRYDVQLSPPNFVGKFKSPYKGRLAQVSYTVLYPKAYGGSGGGISYDAKYGLASSWSVGLTVQAGGKTESSWTPSGDANVSQKMDVDVDDPVQYTFKVKGTTPTNWAPIIDDITFVFTITPKYLSYQVHVDA
jgi:hypothetical protein